MWWTLTLAALVLVGLWSVWYALQLYSIGLSMLGVDREEG